WLDGLRGCAVLMVIFYHCFLLPGGWLGVDVFFVLSGFLITSLLVEEWETHGAISLRRFYLRRALRLLPAFYLLLLLVGLHGWLFDAAARPPHREMLLAACYVANYPALHGTTMYSLGHTWSLSLEEQFYLIWPLLLILMFWLGKSRRWLLTAVGLGIIACACHRIVIYEMFRSPPEVKAANIYRMYMGLDTRADALLMGCLIAFLATWGLLPRSTSAVRCLTWAAWASLAGLVFMARNRCMDHSQLYHGLFTIIALMVATIIVRLLVAPARPVARLLESRWLVGTGRISYGLYLFHMPVIHWVFPGSKLGLSWDTLGVFALTYACALLSYHLLEAPCLRLKDRFRTQTPRIPATEKLAA
ncbi:MAG: acyltransferase family protein, partial [Gemmataceae bacterium]